MDTMITAPAKTPAVRARDAASLLVLGPGPTVLMGLRGAGHKFMPNKLVFPGGSVDRVDATAPASAEPAPHVMALLGKGAKPRLARAIVMAAARELEEETGLSLGVPPALDGLDYLGRAITPPVRPIRFNARFFVVPREAVSGTLAGSGELEDLQWWELEPALALDLAVPTRAVIGLLQKWLALSPDERMARAEAPVMRNRIWKME
jgi:8-oxo-dGTP pyrophosphatase MutT (NUDIX family)